MVYQVGLIFLHVQVGMGTERGFSRVRGVLTIRMLIVF